MKYNNHPYIYCTRILIPKRRPPLNYSKSFEYVQNDLERQYSVNIEFVLAYTLNKLPECLKNEEKVVYDQYLGEYFSYLTQLFLLSCESAKGPKLINIFLHRLIGEELHKYPSKFKEMVFFSFLYSENEYQLHPLSQFTRTSFEFTVVQEIFSMYHEAGHIIYSKYGILEKVFDDLLVEEANFLAKEAEFLAKIFPNTGSNYKDKKELKKLFKKVGLDKEMISEELYCDSFSLSRIFNIEEELGGISQFHLISGILMAFYNLNFLMMIRELVYQVIILNRKSKSDINQMKNKYVFQMEERKRSLIPQMLESMKQLIIKTKNYEYIKKGTFVNDILDDINKIDTILESNFTNYFFNSLLAIFLTYEEFMKKVDLSDQFKDLSQKNAKKLSFQLLGIC